MIKIHAFTLSILLTSSVIAADNESELSTPSLLQSQTLQQDIINLPKEDIFNIIDGKKITSKVQITRDSLEDFINSGFHISSEQGNLQTHFSSSSPNRTTMRAGNIQVVFVETSQKKLSSILNYTITFDPAQTEDSNDGHIYFLVGVDSKGDKHTYCFTVRQLNKTPRRTPNSTSTALATTSNNTQSPEEIKPQTQSTPIHPPSTSNEEQTRNRSKSLGAKSLSSRIKNIFSRDKTSAPSSPSTSPNHQRPEETLINSPTSPRVSPLKTPMATTKTSEPETSSSPSSPRSSPLSRQPKAPVAIAKQTKLGTSAPSIVMSAEFAEKLNKRLEKKEDKK